MLTCQKCRKQNPPDAVFCGFCGAKLAQSAAAPAPVSKTVFGYTGDPLSAARAQAPAPAPAPVAPAPVQSRPTPTPLAQPRVSAPRVAAQPKVVVSAPPAEPTIPLTDADLAAAVPIAGLIGGRFKLGAMLKRLPAGELHQAKDVKADQPVELLLVDLPVFPSPLDMERGRRELRQLQKVECAALLKIIDHGKADDGRLFIAMEPSPGPSLDELVARGPIEMAQAQRVIREVGSALAEAQKMGVIHRDIAPQNILCGAADEVRVRGFAVAAPIKKHIFGTAEFISPEQACGRPVDQRSNIYSLGALLYYMLCGSPPFRAGTADELLQKHQNEEPVSPKVHHPDLALSPRAESLILKALAKSSSRRHLTLRQFLREVESLTDAAPTAEAEFAQPLSFVTPLHGMTALTGGSRPPSSELAPLLAPDAAATLIDAPPAPSRAAQPVLPEPAPLRAQHPAFPVEPAPAPRHPSGLQIPVEPTPAPRAPSGMQAPVAPAPVADAPEPAPAPKKSRQASITGEMSSSVSLRQAPVTEPAPARRPPSGAIPPAEGAPGKPAFRETMWFFKGEVESAMAETDGALPGAATAEATPQELTAKYADDGSLTDEEARRLSLRTGKTQMMMQAPRIPKGPLPGDKMGADDFIHEMNRGRQIAIWSGVVLVLALVAALIVWLLTK